MTASDSPAPPKPPRQGVGCLQLLGYAYAVFVLAVAGAVALAHYKKKEMADWVVEEMSASFATQFMTAYELEGDPLFEKEKEAAKADQTLSADRRHNLLEKKRVEVTTLRTESLQKLRERLVAAQEAGKIGEKDLDELERIFDWLQEVTAKETRSFADYERLERDLEAFLARVEGAEA